MTTLAWVWMFMSLIGEVVGDLLVIYASKGMSYAYIGSFIAYSFMLFSWFKVVAITTELAVPGLIWLSGGAVLTVLIGVLVFGETLNITRIAGVILTFISLILLSL